ncbi:MAG: hypothetical protein CMG19_01985 [Candidatus Marinimicrobia bacterium]|nr:hypothetical protein [Candidatus Neomarinimicrobiota bacterium]
MLIITSCSDDSLRIKKVIVKDNSARLIDSPKTKSPITFVPIGTELDVIKIKDVKKGLFNTTWFQVAYDDTIGWINMFFVTIDTTATIEDMKKIVDATKPDDTFDDSNDYYEEDEETNNMNEASVYDDSAVIDNDEANNNLVKQSDENRLEQRTVAQPDKNSQKFYTVQITSGKDLNAAESLVRVAESKEIDAYIQKGYVDKSGLLWYRVRSGKYQSIDAAQSASIQINEKMNTNSWVDNFRSAEVAKEELIPSISVSLESLPLFNVIDPWMKENIINYNSIKYIKWYDPYIRGTFHLQRVRFSIISNQQELLIDEREFKFWDGKLYSVFDNKGIQLQ